jgi:hypothetical protein
MSDHDIAPGTRVEVRSRYDGRWGRGFEVVGIGDDGYQIKRLSDDHVLPRACEAAEVRVERRRAGLWWA